jgi:hypothetical protein
MYKEAKDFVVATKTHVPDFQLTPEMAIILLGMNTNNRPKQDGVIDKYSEDIRLGCPMLVFPIEEQLESYQLGMFPLQRLPLASPYNLSAFRW